MGLRPGVKGGGFRRHFAGMRTILCLPILFAACAWADETADRAAIEKSVAELRFAAGAHVDPEFRLLGHGEPWSEVTPPYIAIRSIRFITADVAVVDAASTQYGSVILVRKLPLLLVMKRQGRDWRIAYLRVMPDCARLVV